MLNFGVDSSESMLIFVLHVETALLSRTNCSCLPAMIDLTYMHVLLSISINNQQYIIHLITISA